MRDKYLFYVGKDKGTLIGVPARDLSYEEAQKHGITSLLASGLYVYNSDYAIPEEYRSDLGLPIEEKKTKRQKKEGK